ncbi:Uncharacterized protein Fot_20805 [Forsythia ovata]|uniref:Uncharacterized protein n=1 Tax=Forsythia ovata TaxID=205694 RepID=A0ABD1UT21_9LAMI
MSSTGASYAHVYVQQKNQKEKLKKREELEIRAKNKAAGCKIASAPATSNHWQSEEQKNHKEKLKRKEELETIVGNKAAGCCMIEKLSGDDNIKHGRNKKIHPAGSFVQ